MTIYFKNLFTVSRSVLRRIQSTVLRISRQRELDKSIRHAPTMLSKLHFFLLLDESILGSLKAIMCNFRMIETFQKLDCIFDVFFTYFFFFFNVCFYFGISSLSLQHLSPLRPCRKLESRAQGGGRVFQSMRGHRCKYNLLVAANC